MPGATADMKRKFVIADQNAVSAEGHFQTYTSALALAAHDAGHDVTVLWNKRFQIDTISAPYRMLPTFSHTEGEADARGILPYGEGHFGRELERALRPLRLGANDLVVVHTCHFVELFELLAYFRATPPEANSPSFHVVARYDPDIFRYRMGHLIEQFDAISRSRSLRDKIRFHSDTEQLASEFGKLFGMTIGVCPIPVDLTRLLPKLADGAAPSSEPLIATYLGTARSEKGYRDLLDAIAFLGDDYIATDRLHFVLQCSEQSLRGEPGLSDYQTRLENYLCEKHLEHKVRLVKDVVDADAYCSLLARSDIVLLGYSPTSYRCRSSSVLVEAMAAGKVVVTRTGSWMASRVGPDHAVCYADNSGLGPAIAEAVDRFEDLSAGAKARRQDAIAASDPAALAAYFVDAGTHCASAVAAAAPLALMIMDGDAMAAGSSAASVFMSRLRYCNAVGYRVVALFLGSEAAAEAAGRRRRLADALRPYSLERVFIERRADIASGSSSELVSFLSDDRPDCILLSRFSDFAIIEALGLAELPVVCETNGRASSWRRDDIGTASLLDIAANHCRALSACASEVQDIREQFPSLSSIHCAFPFALEAPGLDALAGPVTCFEVVASAEPLHLEFDPETNPALARSGRFARLSSLDSVDLLFVSAASEAAAEGLHWFLEKVYRPFLSQRGISLIVAGDIASPDPFPTFDDVFFIGPAACREPLYAAAKIVIAPIHGSIENSLELLEALSKGMPIVATTACVAKIDGGAAQIEAHDGESAFADAIVRLLESPERRAIAAAASFAVAERLGAGSASILGMNELFRSILGERAIAAKANEEPRVSPDAPVEWTPAIRAANSFVRSYVAGAPLEGLDELARLPDQGSSLVTRIAECLLERRSAPLLRIDGRLLAKLTRIADVSDAARVAKIAQISSTPSPSPPPVLLIDRRFAGVVVRRGPCGRTENPQPAAPGLEFFPVLRDGDGETVAWEFAGDGRDAPDFCLLELRDIAQEDEWIVYQRIPVSRGLRALGCLVFANWRFAPKDDGSAKARLVLSRSALAVQTKWTTRIAGLIGIFFSGRRSPLHKWSPWAGANPLFDAGWYVGEYPDVVDKKIAPFKHYNRYGVYEGRHPNPFFDTNWYLDRYPEVRKSGENPLDHYFEVGALEGYDPGPCFSTFRYLDDNPDVRAGGLNALLHYLEHGRREGRDIYPAEPPRPFQSILSPAVIGARGTPWIEIELGPETGRELAPLIDVYCGERKLDLHVHESADGLLLRAVLSHAEVGAGAIRLRAALRTSQADRVEICGLRAGRSSGGADIALEQVERMSRSHSAHRFRV